MALRQRTNAYWAKRANERLVASEKTSDKYRREIRKVYTQAQRDTLEQLKKIYADYWTKDGGFDKQKLRLMTSSKDMNAFVAKLKKAGLYDKIPENYLGRINRLEFLNAQMWYESHLAGMKQDGILTSANRQVYEDSYYRSIYDVSKGIGSTPSFTMLDKQTVNQILDTEFDGKNYSERIWGNSDILANQLKDKLAVAIATGQSIQKTARDFRERFNVQNYYAERLVRTETNYFHNSAELESYDSMGFEYYEFVATLDSRTSEICAEMDGKRFKVSEARQGDNAPPLHPNCRSTIVPYFKDFEPEETRIYRNPETNRNEYAYNMSYENWYDRFVEGQSNQIVVNIVKKPVPESEAQHFKTQFSANYPKDVKKAHIDRLEELGQMFPQVRKEFAENKAIISSNNRLRSTGAKFSAYTSGKPIGIQFGSQYKTLDALKQKVEELVKRKFYMPSSTENFKNYMATHEFGHAVENYIINTIKAKESNQNWANTSAYRSLQEDKIMIKIRNIAKDTDPSFKLSDYISTYGRKDSSEFFAETFANAFCGSPNILGKSMIKYLKESGVMK